MGACKFNDGMVLQVQAPMAMHGMDGMSPYGSSNMLMSSSRKYHGTLQICISAFCVQIVAKRPQLCYLCWCYVTSLWVLQLGSVAMPHPSDGLLCSTRSQSMTGCLVLSTLSTMCIALCKVSFVDQAASTALVVAFMPCNCFLWCRSPTPARNWHRCL